MKPYDFRFACRAVTRSIAFSIGLSSLGGVIAFASPQESTEPSGVSIRLILTPSAPEAADQPDAGEKPTDTATAPVAEEPTKKKIPAKLVTASKVVQPPTIRVITESPEPLILRNTPAKPESDAAPQSGLATQTSTTGDSSSAGQLKLSAPAEMQVGEQSSPGPSLGLPANVQFMPTAAPGDVSANVSGEAQSTPQSNGHSGVTIQLFPSAKISDSRNAPTLELHLPSDAERRTERPPTPARVRMQVVRTDQENAAAPPLRTLRPLDSANGATSQAARSDNATSRTPLPNDNNQSERQDAVNNRGFTPQLDLGKTAMPRRLPQDPASLPLGRAEEQQPTRSDQQAFTTSGKAEQLEDERSSEPPRLPSGSSSELAIAPEKDAPHGECPGSPGSDQVALGPQPDDIPLEQDEHPYDAPAAKRIADNEPPRNNVAARFTARELEIQRGINECLHFFLANPENIARRGPWALMHAALPFGVETDVLAGNRRVNALGWMCYNGVCAKQRMFQPTRTGFRTNLGPGVQGHEGQFLAILAQSQVGPDYPIRIGQRSYTVSDLVKYEMATCREKSELTFKLIGLAHYLPQNARWRDQRGRVWDLEKMVAEELAQPVIGAACGGTHRLMGLSFALVKRRKAGLPITGHWQRAEKYVSDYVKYAMSLQNPDGSFSTEWFKGRGADPDRERKVQTTGHILEWLIFTLPDEHLRSPQIQLSLEYLLKTVGGDPSHDWPIGPRGHALRAMALYNQRVFGAEVGQMRSHVAAMRQQTMRR